MTDFVEQFWHSLLIGLLTCAYAEARYKDLKKKGVSRAERYGTLLRECCVYMPLLGLMFFWASSYAADLARSGYEREVIAFSWMVGFVLVFFFWTFSRKGRVVS